MFLNLTSKVFLTLWLPEERYCVMLIHITIFNLIFIFSIMNRNAAFREYSEHFDSLLPDQDSLLIQLCEHLFNSGFVFVDSTENELETGGWVIRDFFDQEAEVLRSLVPRKLYMGFTEYIKKYNWPAEVLQQKLSLRIQKAFDKLAKGKHHHFNIRYNISRGLRQQDPHPLYELLLYIETYYSLVLGGETKEREDKGSEFPKTNFKIEDLKKLRNQIQERLEGRELVKNFMKHIAKIRGVSVESLVPEEKKERKNSPIKFLRPSQLIPNEDKRSIPNVIRSPNSRKNFIVDKLGINSKPTEDQYELSEITLEPDLEPNIPTTKKKLTTTKNDADENLEENTFETGIVEEPKLEVKGNYQLNEENDSESETKLGPSTVTTVNQLLNFKEDEEDVDFKENDLGLISADSNLTDVVFGGEKITQDALEKFIREFPDSAIRFLLKRSLDGKPLSLDIESVHFSWEKRGMSRARLKKILLKLMEWQEVPDLPILDLLKILKERIYEVSQKRKSQVL